VRRDIYGVKKPGEHGTAAGHDQAVVTEVLDHHGDTIGQATLAAPVTAFKNAAPDKITLSFAR
jgi:hypothetical protein